jgi:hypothetical protein
VKKKGKRQMAKSKWSSRPLKFAVCLLPFEILFFRRLPTAYRLLPTAYCLLPSTSS